MSDHISDSTQPSYPSSDSSDSPPQWNPSNLAAAGVDSSTSSSRFHKKTRDLPNLSECQNCGFRINTTNGKDKLHTLRSEWRIVLLCRKCVRLVDSGEVCPYCFLEISSEKQKCFRCRDCGCCVHDGCILKYKGFAPPSYYCCLTGSGFTVCIDCWLPEPLRKLRSQMVKGDSRNRKVSNRDTDRPNALKDCVNDREDSVNGSNSAKVKKVLAAVKGRDIAAIKPVTVAITAADSSADDMAAVDDAGLAFQLHRSLNSSHRISKNVCSVNNCSPRVPETSIFHGASSVRASSEFHQEQYNGNSNNVKCNIQKSYSNKMISSLGYDNEMHTPSQSCHRGKEMLPAETRNCCQSNSDGKSDRYHFKYTRRKSGVKVSLQKHCQAGCEPKTDRYVLKYSKRKSSSKVKVNMNETRLNGLKTNRYCFKYKKRTARFKLSKEGTEMHLGDNSTHCRASCDLKIDRCYLKYGKKKRSSKEISNYTQCVNIENDMHQDYIRTHFQPVCELKTNRFCLKYSRRSQS